VSLFHTIDFYRNLGRYLFRFYFQNKKDLISGRCRQLKEALDYAYKKVPFYRNKILQNKIDINRIDSLDHMGELPVIGAEDIFLNSSYSDDNKECRYLVLRSSGTAGAPKNINVSYFDWFCLRRLAYLRMFFTSGCSVFHKTLFLILQQPCVPIEPKWFQSLGVMRARSISVSRSVSKNADFFNQYKPDVLYCLTADGVILADFINRNSKYTHRAKHLFTTGEILTEKDKRAMKNNLGYRITDFYANTEVGIIAWQCDCGKYHINADQIYIEILDGKRVCQDGEVGEVVLTTLAPFSFPLIRYRTGDLAALERERCKCGSWFPILTQIKGRKNDFLISTDKKRISPYVLMSAMDAFDEVLQYSIHQTGSTDYTIYLKLSEMRRSESIIKKRIEDQYREILGPKSVITFANFCNLPAYDAGTKRKVITLSMERGAKTLF
jgi:phenylacetate-coenzyme A ligase PaaK-like adenylate-forming protein